METFENLNTQKKVDEICSQIKKIVPETIDLPRYDNINNKLVHLLGELSANS
jgi:hypothetical protein